MNAGGDWEVPICFAFYWDGTEMRGYIPSEGNVWNKELNRTWGNENGGFYDIDEKKLIESIEDNFSL